MSSAMLVSIGGRVTAEARRCGNKVKADEGSIKSEIETAPLEFRKLPQLRSRVQLTIGIVYWDPGYSCQRRALAERR